MVVAVPWRTERRRRRVRTARRAMRRLTRRGTGASRQRRDQRRSTERRHCADLIWDTRYEENQDADRRRRTARARAACRHCWRTSRTSRSSAQCRDGEEAVTAIVDHSPDLVFLDVQMPQMNGFDVIEAVGPERMPLVIFVTAYDQHALRAFQVRALDYLLKPFDRERFTDALQRARKQIERDENGDLGRRLLALVKDLRRDQPRTDRLVVEVGRPAVLPARRRNRLDRGGRQLRAAARRQRRRTCCAKP